MICLKPFGSVAGYCLSLAESERDSPMEHMHIMRMLITYHIVCSGH